MMKSFSNLQRKPWCALLALSLTIMMLLCSLCEGQSKPATSPTPLKPVTLFIEGDSSVIPKFVNLCREKGPEYGFDFRFVDKLSDVYDYRVILGSGGSGVSNYVHGNIVVMNPDSKVLFTVTRSNRLTAKSASALAKDFVKVLGRFVDTHN